MKSGVHVERSQIRARQKATHAKQQRLDRI
jgi:hypothetical protein